MASLQLSAVLEDCLRALVSLYFLCLPALKSGSALTQLCTRPSSLDSSEIGLDSSLHNQPWKDSRSAQHCAKADSPKAERPSSSS